MSLKTFGKKPAGKRLQKIYQSPNYKEGSFKNLSHTVMMTGDGSMVKTMIEFLNKPKNTTPDKKLPSVVTDLKNIKSENPTLVWFGHSSYFIKIEGKTILVDPVFSGSAAPFGLGVKSFDGSDVYKVEVFPEIDLLILTHDHYDHLDLDTIIKLKPKVKQIVTSLGVGSHLSYWGFNEEIVHELDWWETADPLKGFSITAAPARHFSGRGIKRAQTLWSSFVLQAGNWKIYIGADSGYDTHFKQIGEKFGPFDLAILESGQYNLKWAAIHMMPEQTVQAAVDLKANVLLPVHWGKFTLALHAWDEPIERVLKEAEKLAVKVTTPLIGEPIVLQESYPDKKWWRI
ncbi:MBL fold metallo-hydrolase [Solitalea longa]|uniref:MBL fold metallo-hydrolase n=1 Tax=Solitalea longa TaxID=2079460 RepID=A0A2S5A3S4_9SPHI|nr:MBL fold metallo-hydrolase [Solitalea longa]POY37174.1 MBL fold metallo-hydrolase [Solitalea longa]